MKTLAELKKELEAALLAYRLAVIASTTVFAFAELVYANEYANRYTEAKEAAVKLTMEMKALYAAAYAETEKNSNIVEKLEYRIQDMKFA